MPLTLWIIIAVIILALLLIIFLINFYRDPEREITKGDNILAPADGRIISIIDTTKNKIVIKKGAFGRIKTLCNDISNECYVVSIFMSPFDVHINRAPIDGIVKSVKHTKGRFFEAYNLEKSLQNEKNEIIIENKNLKVKVIQVAGFLARRIKCYVKKNQKVNKGNKIGMIALGSQTILIFPKIGNLKVNINEKVNAGQSVIAVLK